MVKGAEGLREVVGVGKEGGLRKVVGVGKGEVLKVGSDGKGGREPEAGGVGKG